PRADSFVMLGGVGATRLRSDMNLEGGAGNDRFEVGADSNVTNGDFAKITVSGGEGNDYFVVQEDSRPIAVLGGSGDDYVVDNFGYGDVRSYPLGSVVLDLGSG